MQFTFSKKDAKPLARALEKFLESKGIELSHGQALDALASMQGYADWNALADKVSPTAIESVLDPFELNHLRDELQEGTRYGEECELRTHTGFALRYSAETQACEYVRTVDALGREIAYWDQAEWQEDPATVMGAIIGSLVRGKPFTLKPSRTDRSKESASVSRAGPAKILSPFTLYTDAFVTDEFGEGPSWARIVIDEAFLERLLTMRRIAAKHRLSDVSEYCEPDSWSPWAVNPLGMSQVQNAELQVTEKSFWFCAPVKHTDYAVESRGIWFKDLLAAISGPEHFEDAPYTRHGNVIVFGVSEESRADFIEELLEDGEDLPPEFLNE